MKNIRELAIEKEYYYRIENSNHARFCAEHGAIGFFGNDSDFCILCGRIPNGYQRDKQGVPVPPKARKILLNKKEIEKLKNINV